MIPPGVPFCPYVLGFVYGMLKDTCIILRTY